MQTALFWVFSIIAIAGGIGLIANRNTVYSALSLILNFFSIAGLYLSLDAQFLSVIQILVYAGAIMVLFLFVIMLLNVDDEPKQKNHMALSMVAWLLGGAFLAELLVILGPLKDISRSELATEAFRMGSVEAVGEQMMTSFLFPFEIISVILISGLVGAIVIAKKHLYPNQSEI